MTGFTIKEAFDEAEHPDKKRYPILYDTGDLYFWNDAEVWCAMEESDEWGLLTLNLLQVPPSRHFFDYIEENQPLAEYLALEHPEDAETWMLQNGVAPGQRFKAVFHYAFWQTNSPITGYDCDEELDIAVLEVEPWPMERVATAWEAYFGRKALMEKAGVI